MVLVHLTGPEPRPLRDSQKPLPITETGYRSHFTAPETAAPFGGPVAYVIAWLDEESETPGMA
jgi:hypothetical protein